SSGTLTRSAIAALYDGAAVVVYPSYYEGFGLPIVDAIASGIPVVALNTAVNRELRSLTDASRLFLVNDLGELRSLVGKLIDAPITAPTNPDQLRTWGDVAREYARSFEDLLSQDLNIDLIQRRWELFTTIDAVHPL